MIGLAGELCGGLCMLLSTFPEPQPKQEESLGMNVLADGLVE